MCRNFSPFMFSLQVVDSLLKFLDLCIVVLPRSSPFYLLNGINADRFPSSMYIST